MGIKTRIAIGIFIGLLVIMGLSHKEKNNSQNNLSDQGKPDQETLNLIKKCPAYQYVYDDSPDANSVIAELSIKTEDAIKNIWPHGVSFDLNTTHHSVIKNQTIQTAVIIAFTDKMTQKHYVPVYVFKYPCTFTKNQILTESVMQYIGNKES